MTRKISLSIKRIWPLVAFIIVILIVWNTNVLFQKLKNEERLKMELWAMAQKDFIENKKPNNLTFKVLQQTGINPMFQVNANDKIIDFKNFPGEIMQLRLHINSRNSLYSSKIRDFPLFKYFL